MYGVALYMYEVVLYTYEVAQDSPSAYRALYCDDYLEAVVELVQKGVGSRFYDRGRYSPGRETGTHHFHQLIAEAMG